MLLCQQQIAVLNDGVLYRALYLGRKAAFTVEALMYWSLLWTTFDQPVEGIVAILAEYDFVWRWHGRVLRKTQLQTLSIGGYATCWNYQN
jgi:hypothetical protein